MRDIRIKFPGNGLATDSLRSFSEKAGAYPECKMFAKRLPAYGFYFWHVRGFSISAGSRMPPRPGRQNAPINPFVQDGTIHHRN